MPTRWKAEQDLLRELLASCQLVEQKKWGKPCFCYDGKNIAILQPMKDHLALMFFKGELLNDPHGLLQPVGPNSRSARRILFTDAKQVSSNRGKIRALVRAAMKAEIEGRTVPKPTKIAWVAELQQRLAEDPAFKEAFSALTPGRQREYHLHFSAAKQSNTRMSRIEKCAPKILSGKGFRD